MIYVEWFKTEVNRSGKLGGATAHARERPGVCNSTFFQSRGPALSLEGVLARGRRAPPGFPALPSAFHGTPWEALGRAEFLCPPSQAFPARVKLNVKTRVTW